MTFEHWLVILRFYWMPTGGHLIAFTLRYEISTPKHEVRRRAQEEIDRLASSDDCRWYSADIVKVPAQATETVYATEPLFAA